MTSWTPSSRRWSRCGSGSLRPAPQRRWCPARRDAITGMSRNKTERVTGSKPVQRCTISGCSNGADAINDQSLAYPQVLSRSFAFSSRRQCRCFAVQALRGGGLDSGSSTEKVWPQRCGPFVQSRASDCPEPPLQIDVGIVADVVGHLEDAVRRLNRGTRASTPFDTGSALSRPTASPSPASA